MAPIVVDMDMAPEEELELEPGDTHEETLRITKKEAGETHIYSSGGRRYVIDIMAASVKDPVLTIRDDETGELLGWDDDSGDGRNARLEITVKRERGLLVRAHSLQPDRTGTVKYRVRCK